MNIRFFTLTLFLLGTLSTIQAQCKQDSLFLQQMVGNSKLIEGKAYFFQTDKQHSSPEYNKSRLIKEKDAPVFDFNEQLTNGLPFNEFGNKPIVFKNVKMGEVKIGTETRPCYILSFTCDKQNYCAYEFRESSQRETYNLIEADILNNANKLLVGKTLYTKSANWFKYDETKINSNLELEPVREGTCKYCPVTVTRVVNDYDDMYLVLFKPDNQEEEYCFINIKLGKGVKSDFVHFLTFANPREKYSDISQERWEQIMSQKVKKGFTPDEVKIAYGKPDEVYTEDDNETWVFYNLNKKDYSITFKDGLVDKVASQTSTYY
ncbi:MAG: hypothetical protein FWD60_09165 [Candidatus Azobacteroides sp.]|nr:hypothetical protein [Candidatus Azobacteroides sp.]